MVDNLSPEDRQRTMGAVKGKGTKLEKRLFVLLAGMRLRGWKQNVENLAGKPDVVFANERLIIFVDGCFWHGCPVCRRTLPETNRAYWERKIRRNMELSKTYTEQLESDNWTVLRIWEHEIVDAPAIRTRIAKALAGKGADCG